MKQEERFALELKNNFFLNWIEIYSRNKKTTSDPISYSNNFQLFTNFTRSSSFCLKCSQLEQS
jgi:hypothetical protein